MNIKNYPKVYSKFKEFNRKLLDVWINQAVGENMDEKELNPDYLDTVSESVLGFNPRILYDFLDGEGVYVTPVLLNDIEPMEGWKASVSRGGEISTGDSRLSRKEAEEDGFNQAFKMLEEIL